MSRMRRLLAIGLLSAAVCSPLSAHRGQDALTVIEIDDARGEVRATHHFAAHDIEPQLPRLAPDVAASLDDPDAQDALTAHIVRAFTLSTPDGDIALALEALQLRGDDIRVIYRGAFPPGADALEVRSTLGATLVDGSTHQVNVRRHGLTRTLVFEGPDEFDEVPFDAAGTPASAAAGK